MNNYPKIIGIGIDIIEVTRIASSCQKWVDRFEQRIYTQKERNYCGKPPFRYQRLAARFAAKEATFKALGTGLINGMQWTDIEVLPDELGKPIITLLNETKRYAETIGVSDQMITLSHTNDYAVANVILFGYPSTIKT